MWSILEDDATIQAWIVVCLKSRKDRWSLILRNPPHDCGGMHLELSAWSFLVSVVLWTGVGRGAKVANLHAPCYKCQFYHMMQHEKALHDKQVAPHCQSPCSCENEGLHCMAGVNQIKDGCGCCMICARQLNQSCDYRLKCDEDKELFCDYKVHEEISGLCKKRPPKQCLLNGKLYKHGDRFNPSCRSLCLCRDGKYGCVSLCPEEEKMPTNMACTKPQLTNVTGNCCKQWVCPHIATTHTISTLSEPATESAQRSKCAKGTTKWTPCSLTCGVGVSTRVIYDNDECRPIKQRRLCTIRPCSAVFLENFTSCRKTYKPDHAAHIHNKDCKSVQKFRPKYCSMCERIGCCVPHRTKTTPVEFLCQDGRHLVEDYMWIQSCLCGQKCTHPH